MDKIDVDVLVLGGGPAGCATALALVRRGISAVVVERTNYDVPRIGETIPPATRQLLTTLGIWDRFLLEDHSPSFGIRSVWGQGELYENDFIFNPYGAGWHVDRARFDAMLAMAAEESGAKVYRDAQLASITPDEGSAGSRGWQAEVSQGGIAYRFHTKFLVDASGRAASLARRQGSRRVVYDHLIGAVAFLPADSTLDSFTLVEAIEQGWWYSARLPNSGLVMAYMTDADLYTKGSKNSVCHWQGQLQLAHHTYIRAKGFDVRTTPCISPAGSSRLDQVVGGNWLAVGDAAMSFDPLSSLGIFRALEFGLRAARAIEAHLAGGESAFAGYARAVIESFDDYLHARKKFYSRESRWPHSTFWQRRHAASHRHADWARRPSVCF